MAMKFGMDYVTTIGIDLMIKRWKTIHNVEKDEKLYEYTNRYFEVKYEESFNYIRLIQDKSRLGFPMCICINEFDVYGSDHDSQVIPSVNDNDESVTIIERLRQ